MNSFHMNGRVVHAGELTGKFAEIEKCWIDDIKLTLARLQANEEAFSTSLDEEERAHVVHSEIGHMLCAIIAQWIFERVGYDVGFPEIIAMTSAISSELMSWAIAMYRDDQSASVAPGN